MIEQPTAQYVFNGQYREFRGYVFAHGNPVTIRDKATLEAIQCDNTFKRVDEKQETKAAPAVPETIGACPKCGKVFGTGRTMHVRFCKGEA